MDGLPTVMILTIQILPPKAFEWAKETWVVMEEAKDQGKDFRVERSRLVVHQAEGAHTEVQDPLIDLLMGTGEDEAKAPAVH